MKRLLIIFAIILLFPVMASATWYLACDIPTDSASGSNVRIDGTTVVGLFQVSADGTALILLDLTPYNDGAGHTFEARFTAVDSLPSAWSAPFAPGVLNSPVLRLFQQ